MLMIAMTESDIFFWQACTKQKKIDNKMLSAVITGVHRAFPFSKGRILEEIRLVHSHSYWSFCQVYITSSRKKKSLKGRFSSELDGTSAIWLFCEIKRNWLPDVMKYITLQEEIWLIGPETAKISRNMDLSKLQGDPCKLLPVNSNQNLPTEYSCTAIGKWASALDALSVHPYT